MISSFWRYKILPFAGAALASATIAAPEPAMAQFNVFRQFVPQLHLPGGGGYYCCSGGGRQRYKPHPNPQPSGNDNPATDHNDQVLAALAVPKAEEQTIVFKSIVPSAALGSVGSTDDLKQPGAESRADLSNEEEKRDYIKEISKLINKITSQMERQKSKTDGDITQYAIEQAVDDAYKHSNLQRFETFLGENWTADRLRVMILDHVYAEIDKLFTGTNQGQVRMNDLRTMIQKSADVVYSRLFETSELLASNRSSALFVQRLYQTHGALIEGDVRDSAEHLLMQASGAVTGKFGNLIRRDENTYALHYRLERILFDCLSENVEKISSAEQGVASPEEIAQRISTFESDKCTAWIDTQFKDANGKLKPQEPMPLRVIWTAEGPNEDASMYGRPSSAN